MTLLTKQIWRLKTCENSLFHKGFKAKFFPECLIMECANTNKGSYAQKSLLQARHIVDLGASWRIGNEESTLTRFDKWLPKHPPARIASPPATLPLDSKVSVLIDEVNHSWNSALVKIGFLTCSGYHLLVGVERNVNPTCSNSEMKHKLWNSIWGLQTPHKVKHMIPIMPFLPFAICGKETWWIQSNARDV